MTETDIDLKDGEDFLCVLAEQGNRRFALVRKGEGLLIRPFDARGPDREFESLPSLLSGLQSFFLELRVADSPAKGFAELAAAQEKAKSDVIEASRRIYASLDEKKD
jgi:hypothetical protein